MWMGPGLDGRLCCETNRRWEALSSHTGSVSPKLRDRTCEREGALWQMEQHRHKHLSGETHAYSGKGKGRLAEALHRVHLGE